MKIGLISVLTLALVTMGSAANQEEVLQFSKILISTDESGLNATIISPNSLIITGRHSYYYNVTLDKDTLIMAERFSADHTGIDESDMGYSLSKMARHAGTIFKQYPDQFKKLDLKLYDPSNTLIGRAILVASNQSAWQTFPPPENPRSLFTGVKIT